MPVAIRPFLRTVGADAHIGPSMFLVYEVALRAQ